MPLVYIVYLSFSFIFGLKRRQQLIVILLTPIYAFIQSTLIPVASIIMYFYRGHKHQNFGIIRIRHEDDKHLVKTNTNFKFFRQFAHEPTK
mgnify:CR=1 FL=1